MKALNSLSVQILLIGSIVAIVMVAAFMWAESHFDVNAPMEVITIIISGFSGLVVARKGREIYQAKNGQYYDDKEGVLKNAE